MGDLRLPGQRGPAPGPGEDRGGHRHATWSYGKAILKGERHIVWRRVGTHDILTGP
ncbi:hypothetical protein OG349_06315 [Streptomyces sp. NBC_01317]|uniref:hypothetical protein n=1 Tax=Streptomyces sp. NBC_01317 TaxID=2903822 RepID=UPI002E138778|nr:hypothetical protein OG349_06315 [Streptomyces sp. NBC_01317]